MFASDASKAPIRLKMGIACSCGKKSDAVQVIERGKKEVSLDDFRILRAIGKGSFGKVCIVQKKDTMKLYAMKYMNKSQCVEKEAFKNVMREIEILSALEHPFLVNLWFTFQDEEDMFMVVDLLLGGDLRYHLQQSCSPFEEARVSLYICEIALALDYLRTKRILHRDVKPDNILIDVAGHVHLTDFNIATIVKDGQVVTSISGTKPYIAPEVILCALDRTHGYSFPADWWSLGITAYEMLCKIRPYDIHSSDSMETIHNLIQNSCVRFPKRIDKGLVNLVRQLLNVNPGDRISSLKQMKKDNYMESMDFNAVYNCQVAPPFIPSKDTLNCDPTFELEEMIIESKPLHKKKKRLSKRSKARNVLTSQTNQDEEKMQARLSTIQKEFIIYNRERDLQHQKSKEKSQEENS